METPQYEIGKPFQYGHFMVIVTAEPDLDYRPIDGEIVDASAEMMIVTVTVYLDTFKLGSDSLGAVDSRDIKGSVEANGMLDIAIDTAKESARNLAARLALINPHS